MGEIAFKPLKINFLYPEDLRSHFITNAVVQNQQDHFILAFFEIWPPVIVTDDDEEKRAVVESLNTIDAKCVARLVMTPAKMEEIVGILSQNLRLHKEKHASLKETEEE